MQENSQPTQPPSSQERENAFETTTKMLEFSEQIRSILLAQPLNPLVRLEMRSMGRLEQEQVCSLTNT